MAEIIRIPDGNAFLLRVTGQIRTGDYTEDADFSVVTHMGVNFVRRGRIAQTFGLDSLGRIVIENSGNLAQGVYGVELYGYYHGEPWRNYQKNVFQIVNENANSDPGSDNENVLTYDVTFDVTFGGDGISAAFVEATVATHNGDQESHPDLREEIEEKVSDVKVGDTSVVEGGVAVIDLSGKQDVIDDLSTIRSGAAAGGTAYQKPGTGIPESDMSDAVKAKLAKAETALQQHQDISGKQDVIDDLSTIRSGAAAGGTAYQKPGTGIPASDLSAEVQDMIENGGKTKSVSVNGGTPVTPDANGLVDLTIEQANVTVGTVTTGAAGSNADVHNSGTPTAPVLDFVIPKGDTGATGPQGPQGDSVIVGQGDLPLTHVLGQSTEKAMSQKGVTSEISKINALLYYSDSIDLDSLTEKAGFPANDSIWVISTRAQEIRIHVSIPVVEGETYTMVGNSVNGSSFIFLVTDQIPSVNHEEYDKVPGTGKNILSAGELLTFTIPTGCNYLAISKSLTVADDYLPESLGKGNTSGANIKDAVDNLSNAVINMAETIDDIEDEIENLKKGKPRPYFGENADWETIESDEVNGTLLECELVKGSLPDDARIRFLGGRPEVSGQFIFSVYDSDDIILSRVISFLPLDGTITTLFSSGKCVFRIVVDGSKMDLTQSFKDWGEAMPLNAKYLTSGTTPKKIICFGDSITEFADTNSMTYPDYLGMLSCCDVFNAGIGGTRLARRGTPTTSISTEMQAYAAMDISNLVSSWVNDSWDEVDAAVTWLYNHNHAHDYREKIANLKAMDISDIDIITIFGGTNDFTGDAVMGEIGSTNIEEIAGGIETMFNLIQTANPNIDIFVVSPIVRYLNNNRTSAYWSDNYVSGGTNMSGKKLPDVVDFIGDVCKHYHVKFNNWYWTLGWNQFNFSNYFNDNDGTHPYKGFKYIAERLFKYIESNTTLTK